MKKGKKSAVFIIAAFVALCVYVAFAGLWIPGIGWKRVDRLKGATDIRFGIDIRGGVEAVFEPPTDYDATKEEMDAARSIIEKRLDAKLITDREITVSYDQQRIIVRYPWKSTETSFNPQAAIAELGEMALLTFRDPDGEVIMEGKHVKQAYAQYNSEAGHHIVLELNSEGAELFDAATGRLVGKNISTYLDDLEVSVANVNERISGGTATITGNFTAQEAKDLADTINAGALPFKLQSTSNSAISPILGSNALDVMIFAGGLSFALICIFMLLYYRASGLVACISLTGVGVSILMSISIPQFSLTLPGIAGVILSIGVGVDANVIISERIKEELRSGKSVERAIGQGFDRAFSAILDGNIAVLIAAVILYNMGSGPIMSFGYTLMMGVIFNLFWGVFISKQVYKSLAQYRPMRNPQLFGGQKEGAQKKEILGEGNKILKTYNNRVKFFIISGVLILTGVIGAVINGVQLDIQFKGGAIIKYTYEGDLDKDSAAASATDVLGRSVTAQTTQEYGTNTTRLVLNVAGNEGIDAETQILLDERLHSDFSENNIEISESTIVNPFVGRDFLMRSLLAVVIAAILILIYVWFRFRKIGGLPAALFALTAIIHDLVMVLITFILFGIPLNDSFIAIVLAILGYSINDTIVIYDRIRENRKIHGDKKTEVELLNLSVSQSFVRTMLTSLTTIISMTAIYIFAVVYGIDSIKTFALPLLIGVTSGWYSSVCLATSLCGMWRTRKSAQSHTAA